VRCSPLLPLRVLRGLCVSTSDPAQPAGQGERGDQQQAQTDAQQRDSWVRGHGVRGQGSGILVPVPLLWAGAVGYTHRMSKTKRKTAPKQPADGPPTRKEIANLLNRIGKLITRIERVSSRQFARGL